MKLMDLKLLDQVRLLLRKDDVNHILIPRKILFQLFLLQLPFISLCLALWNGVWIIVSGLLIAYLAAYERIFYTLWRRYYARFTFIVQLMIAIALGFGGRWLIYTALSLIFNH